MPRQPNPVPSYLLHAPTGQAYVRVPDGAGGRRTVYFGAHGSAESRQAYARLLAELRVGDPPGLPGSDRSVNEVLVVFLKWAATHYRDPDGNPTPELNELKASVRPVRDLYGHAPAADFGPLALKAVRWHMVDAGLTPGSARGGSASSSTPPRA